MLESTLENLLIENESTKNQFIEAFAFNEYPQIRNYPISFIINTQPRNMRGEHWLAVFIDSYKNAYFFDSYGQAPSFYKLDQLILRGSSNYYYNQKRLQGNQPYCGLYCLFFLIAAAKNNIQLFLNKFNSNLYSNDIFINNNYFNYLNKINSW